MREVTDRLVKGNVKICQDDQLIRQMLICEFKGFLKTQCTSVMVMINIKAGGGVVEFGNWDGVSFKLDHSCFSLYKVRG